MAARNKTADAFADNPLPIDDDPFGGLGDAPVASGSFVPDMIEIDTEWELQEPLSIGTHEVVSKVVDIRMGPKGPYLSMRYEGTANEGDEEGFMARDNLSLSKAAKFKMDDFLAAIAWPRGKAIKGSPEEVKAILSGHILKVAIDHEEYNEKAQAKVAAYLPKGSDTGAKNPVKVGAAEFA